MALIKYGPLIAGASGALDSIIFRQGRGGAVATIRPQLCRHDTPRAALARAATRNTNNEWTSFTAEKRAAWTSLANRLGRTNRLGLSSPPTGKSEFFRWAYLQFYFANLLYNTVPRDLNPGIPAATSLSFSAGGPYTVNFDPTIPFKIAFFYGARAFNTSAFRYTRWHLLTPDFIGGGSPTSSDLYPYWAAILGDLQPGEIFAVKIIWADLQYEILSPPIILKDTF